MLANKSEGHPGRLAPQDGSGIQSDFQTDLVTVYITLLYVAEQGSKNDMWRPLGKLSQCVHSQCVNSDTIFGRKQNILPLAWILAWVLAWSLREPAWQKQVASPAPQVDLNFNNVQDKSMILIGICTPNMF